MRAVDLHLDRLTEWHEALTQTVELMVHQQREWQGRNERWQEKNRLLIADVLDSIHSLERPRG